MGLTGRENKEEEESRKEKEEREENEGEKEGDAWGQPAGSHQPDRHGRSRKSRTYRMKVR